jgi:hypothetical protein
MHLMQKYEPSFCKINGKYKEAVQAIFAHERQNLDATMKLLISKAVEPVQSQLRDLEANLSTPVDSIQPQLDGLESWLKTDLQKDISHNHGNIVKTIIPTFEGRVTAINNGLSALQTGLLTLESRVTDLCAGIVELESYVPPFKILALDLRPWRQRLLPPIHLLWT